MPGITPESKIAAIRGMYRTGLENQQEMFEA